MLLATTTSNVSRFCPMGVFISARRSAPTAQRSNVCEGSAVAAETPWISPASMSPSPFESTHWRPFLVAALPGWKPWPL